ncbi:TPA: helix-turn-helix domain-containing protein [Morganella morganii]
MTKFTPRLIKNDDELQSCMMRIIELAASNPVEGTEEFDEVELLGILIENYENKNYNISKPDPIDAIKFRMEQMGLTNKDMTPFIGSLSKVSEVLNRKRPLSLSMIRRLHDGFGIPADILIQDMSGVEWEEVDVKLITEKFTVPIKDVELAKYNRESQYARMKKLGTTFRERVTNLICNENYKIDKFSEVHHGQSNVRRTNECASVDSEYCFVG